MCTVAGMLVSMWPRCRTMSANRQEGHAGAAGRLEDVLNLPLDPGELTQEAESWWSR